MNKESIRIMSASEPTRGKHFVYMAYVYGAEHPIKIGSTWNLGIRLTQIARQNCSDKKPRLLSFISFKDKWPAVSFEREIHRVLKFKFKRSKNSEYWPCDTELIQWFMTRPGAEIL